MEKINLLLSILGFSVGYFGVMYLLKWGMDKDVVITWKPFSIKIEKKEKW